MIRKDLQDLSELKKSSMLSAYGGYSNSHLGSSNYRNEGMFSSKSSVCEPQQ